MREATGFLDVMEREMAREKLSLREYAKRLGLHHSTLCLLRAGKIRPGVHTMDVVERAYREYSRDYLFPRDEVKAS